MRIGAIVLAAVLAFPPGAAAMPFSYYREHKAWCDASLKDDKDRAFEYCANRGWCDAHGNDDRITRIYCDPFRSQADVSLLAVKVSAAGLDAGRDLSDVETQSFCFDVMHAPDGCGVGVGANSNGIVPDWELLPAGMKTARLALAALINLGPFPATVVKIGIGTGGKAVMSLTWSINGNGPRRTETIRLGGNEVDHLLAALNRSDFWRLPRDGHHMGPTDGEIATVEVSMPGRRHHVTDTIGPEDGVDLSVLVNEISRIISRHWRNVPA